MNKQRILLLVIALLSLAGVIVSALTIYEHVLIQMSAQTGLTLESGFCKIGATFNCKKVIGSHWSYLFGIPLGYFGIAFYLLILGLAVTAFEERFMALFSSASTLLLVTLSGVIASVLLFYISSVEIGALCPLCLTTYGINILLLFASYVLDTGHGFGARLRQGMSCATAFPGVLLGLRGAGNSFGPAVARIWVLTAFLGLLWMWALPDYLGNQFVLPQAQDQHFIEQENKALAAWEKAPVQDISLSLDAGAFGDYFSGTLDAPIRVVEFSDYECPACRTSSVALADVFTEFSSKVLLVHRDYPLDDSCNPSIPQPFHLSACFAANLARCAGEQGKFKEASAMLFQHPALETRASPEAIREPLLASLSGMGLDRQGLEECVSSNRHLEKIRSDAAEGDRLGIEGTPSYWVNGKKLAIVTPTTLRRIFEEILKTP
jgi:protein-disulfide isomerase/uncharacterized membrane protein